MHLVFGKTTPAAAVAFTALAAVASSTPAQLSVAAPGDVVAIPAWDVQSSATASPNDPLTLSKPGTVPYPALEAAAASSVLSSSSSSSSSWHHAPVSRCTVMACLLAAGVYNDTDLFYSDHLAAIDKGDFQVPWLYRSEFQLAAPPTGNQQRRHYLLETNGITSRAEIYLDGQQVADKVLQSGAYGGHVYDVTAVLAATGSSNGTSSKSHNSKNSSSNAADTHALVVRAYPTDYLQDFGLGFVDWNPYPPDNGTGVWRNITLRQIGPVAIEAFSVVTNFTVPSSSSSSSGQASNGVVTLRAVVRNLEATAVQFSAAAVVARSDGSGAPLHAKLASPSPSPSSSATTTAIQLAAGQATPITLTVSVDTPAVWWPKQWGDQPLYTAHLTVTTPTATSNGSANDDSLSDTATKTFGFRQVTATVSRADDILFVVNGLPFQVLGGGYTPDVFLRWDTARFEAHARYALDMGLNTIRLEGKMEQPELYAVADRLGLMVLPGWECCDKWEAWPYNDNLPTPVALWSDADYATANASMRHEAAMQQSHPSLLGFLVGSDFWPDDRATAIYTTALAAAGWQAPIVASAAKAGYPKALGPGGMKMPGPYDWVPPNYWYDVQPASDDDRYGAAFGFGSEQGAGGGTPTLASLQKFLSAADLDDLWRQPNKGLYHMSTAVSEFHNRTIFNEALWQRYGAPASLADYVLKTQMADYEGTRAMFEAFAANWGTDPSSDMRNNKRPATGVVYWMLNGAWPALHWSLFDYYLHPAGAYYGVKAATGRLEHVVYDYLHRSVALINRSRDRAGARTVRAELIAAADGRVLSNTTTTTAASSTTNTTNTTTTTPNTSKTVMSRVPGVADLDKDDVGLLRLTLTDGSGTVLSRNVYWLSGGLDALDWDASNWYYTPVSQYTSLQALDKLPAANVSVTVKTAAAAAATATTGNHTVVLENLSSVPAVFVSLDLVDTAGAAVTPVLWSENYVTLFPHETLELTVTESVVASGAAARGKAIEVAGKNVAKATLAL
ncbi:glycoside hydrolase family 2 [Niveomyces insectorum RCEF 264]|uniref:Glycoside hydrolase family 2 n=1 Tax=Niveomyces insectorum RCEF 264 TaxID=1081102 RepID=A0A167ZCP0_9HYPO|nr:glycoside hydrolase family 2 [Niveomyces insectorum RCEF 264]